MLGPVKQQGRPYAARNPHSANKYGKKCKMDNHRRLPNGTIIACEILNEPKKK